MNISHLIYGQAVDTFRYAFKIFTYMYVYIYIDIYIYIYIWLVVWTPLKNISQLGLLFPIYGKIKHVPNHQPDLLDHGSWISSFGASIYNRGSKRPLAGNLYCSPSPPLYVALIWSRMIYMIFYSYVGLPVYQRVIVVMIDYDEWYCKYSIIPYIP